MDVVISLLDKWWACSTAVAAFSYIKKWINKILNKGFIYKLILLAAALFLLTTKPGGGV